MWAQVGSGKGGWKKIKGTWVEVSGSVPKHAEDWACCNCDEGDANYQGIDGFYKHCQGRKKTVPIYVYGYAEEKV